MVVEDDPDTREMVETFLDFEGYAVCTAKHGLDALDRLRDQRPCLILLDVMMPVMDGIAFARELRRRPDPDIAFTPILLLTAVPNAHTAVLETGAVGVVPKPIDFLKVSDALKRHCGPPER